jgi:ABC-type amino acid transport/signal transduction systems, periplasmic component/domain
MLVVITAVATIAGGVAMQRAEATQPPLEIAVEDAADVWSRRDGTGYANDVVRAAFAASGVRIHLQVVPYARCKAMVIQRVVPACFSMSHHPSIPSSIVFSELPIFVFNSDFVQNVRRPLGVHSMRELQRGTVVGVVLGYEYPPAVYELERRGVIVLREGTTETINLRKLADGRLDAALVNFNETKTPSDFLADAGVAGRVERVFTAGSMPAYIGFNRNHPQGLKALAQYNAGRRAIAANGELRDIGRRWRDSVRIDSAGTGTRTPVRTGTP